MVEEFGSHSGYQIPPDSTGKIIITTAHMAVVYDTGTSPFIKGSVVTGQTSGATGIVAGVKGTTSDGTVFLVMSFTTPVDDFTIDENLLVGGGPYAKVVSSDLFIPR